MRVLVLGGLGFIGRSIVEKLQAQEADVLVGSRKKSTNANQLEVNFQAMLHKEDWLPILREVDVVVNSVGILRERKKGESYEKIHTLAPAALAKACAKLGVRFIHISAIGLSLNAKSGFIRSKYLGEQAILNSGASATIVRSSLLDGEGGYGAKWFRRVATWPLQLVMRSDGLIAPLQVADLGEAVANLCLKRDGNLPKVLELGGNETLSIAQYLNWLRATGQRKAALQIAVPKMLVQLASHLFDMLAWTPLSFGHFELMQGKNVPEVNWLPILLGRTPADTGLMAEKNDTKVLKKPSKLTSNYLDPLEAA
ncbi:MAG: sugar nucleotide-binding protein [Methylophilaceae bacterium]